MYEQFTYHVGKLTDMSSQTFTIPTFKPTKVQVKPPKKVDILTLSTSQISSLRKDDPFMYYSIFRPNGQLSSKFSGKDLQEDSTLMVQRRTRVSTESDLDLQDIVGHDKVV